MQKDFITVTPDSGTGDAIITVKVEETDALQNRESSLNISTSGISRTVSVTQGAALPIEEGTNYNAIITFFNPDKLEEDEYPYVNKSYLAGMSISDSTVTSGSIFKDTHISQIIDGTISSYVDFKHCRITIENYNTNPVLTKIEMSTSGSGFGAQTVFVGTQGITCVKGKLVTPIIIIQYTNDSRIATAALKIEFYEK